MIKVGVDYSKGNDETTLAIRLGDEIVQFVEDKGMSNAYWIVFKDMPDNVFKQLLEIYNKSKLIYI
jgi:hypothetical protein